MADRDLGLPFFFQKLGGIPMFTFGSSPVLDLDNARLFAQQFQLEEDRPTLRRIARASALCHHDLVQCLDAAYPDSTRGLPTLSCTFDTYLCCGVIDIFELKQLEKIKVETQQSQGRHIQTIYMICRGPCFTNI